MNNEIWKPVPGYEDNYIISNFGNIQTVATTFRNIRPGRLLKPTACKNGYCIVRLWSKGSGGKPLYVHRLVMLAFVGPCPRGEEVNHKDGNRTNNRLDNLEYMTRSENNFHSYHFLGRKASPTYGEKHHNAKLTRQKAAEIREKYATGNYTYAALGREYGVNYTTIKSIVLGRTWIITKD